MQERLKTGSVLLAGLGATGSAAALYLAAAGVGHLSLWDPNLVTPADGLSAIAHDPSRVGIPRARSAAWMLSALHPGVAVEVVERESDVAGRIPAYPVVISSLGDWPDLARVCRQSGCLLLLCSAHGEVGAVAAFGPQGPCLSCLGLERAQGCGLSPEDPGVGVAGAPAAAAGVVGTIAATEAVKALLGQGEPLSGRVLTYDGRVLTYDGRRTRFGEIAFDRRPDCRDCAVRG